MLIRSLQVFQRNVLLPDPKLRFNEKAKKTDSFFPFNKEAFFLFNISVNKTLNFTAMVV